LRRNYFDIDRASSRTNIPHLHPKNIELNAFIRERLVAKGLAGCTDYMIFCETGFLSLGGG
jgi:hypothetical protein